MYFSFLKVFLALASSYTFENRNNIHLEHAKKPRKKIAKYTLKKAEKKLFPPCHSPLFLLP